MPPLPAIPFVGSTTVTEGSDSKTVTRAEMEGEYLKGAGGAILAAGGILNPLFSSEEVTRAADIAFILAMDLSLGAPELARPFWERSIEQRKHDLERPDAYDTSIAQARSAFEKYTQTYEAFMAETFGDADTVEVKRSPCGHFHVGSPLAGTSPDDVAGALSGALQALIGDRGTVSVLGPDGIDAFMRSIAGDEDADDEEGNGDDD